MIPMVIGGLIVAGLLALFVYGVWLNMEGTKVKEWLRSR